MIGGTILHYKIIAKLGEGGMGVVYKAEDTKLERTVALKFLPQNLTTTETERARFLQEAKAAAALNNPNVCVIYEVQDTGDEPFIVMEYVDGQNLSQMIKAEGAIAVDEALGYATQIAEALNEAHHNGIVHRDIKSENIMLNAKNQIKVMDFGLAKLKGSVKLTKTSTTLGTLAYMAPEQIEGKKTDARADIFSFGVVLFEMLAGELPFGGDYEAALMYSVLHDEPEDLRKHVPDASTELVHVINRSLEKQPDERYQNIGDMLIDLRRAQQKTESVSHPSLAEKPVHKTATKSQSKISVKVLGLAGGMIAVLLLAFFFLKPEGPTRINPDMSFRVLSTPYPDIGYSSLSRDGNWMAFPSKDPDGLSGIYLMNTAGGDARRVATNPIQIASVDISPDASQVAYTRWFSVDHTSAVFVASSLGGQSRELATNAAYPVWRPDGRRIGYLRWRIWTESKKHEIWSIRPDGTDDRHEWTENQERVGGGRIAFSWSPDGGSIAWLRTFLGPVVEIVLIDLASGEERQLTFDQKLIDEVKWTTGDDIIFSSTRSGNTNLWMMPARGGEAVQITKGSGPDVGIAVSADMKKLLYTQQMTIGHIWSADSSGGNSRQLTFEDEHLQFPQLSHDGQKIVYARASTDPTKAYIDGILFVMNRDGSNRRRIISSNQLLMYPRWSPDDRWIAYQVAGNSSGARVSVVPADVSGKARPKVIARGRNPYWIDSQTLYFKGSPSSTSFSIPLQDEEPERVYQDSTYAMPIMGGKYLFIADYRVAQAGFYVISSDDAQSQIPDAKDKIGDFTNVTEWSLSRSGRYLLEYHAAGEVWKVSLPDGRRQRLGGAFANSKIEPLSISFSADDTEAVYSTTSIRGKLVLIENFVE